MDIFFSKGAIPQESCHNGLNFVDNIHGELKDEFYESEPTSHQKPVMFQPADPAREAFNNPFLVSDVINYRFDPGA